MIESIELNHSQRKQELINGYEEFRTFALKKPIYPHNDVPGFSILLFRGMAAWMKAFLSSELIHSSQPSFNNLETINSIEHPSHILPHAVHKEAVMILTSMLLFHQQEASNDHA